MSRARFERIKDCKEELETDRDNDSEFAVKEHG